MKNRIIVILSICLLLTCFTACRQQESPTPTDRLDQTAQTDVESNGQQNEEENQEKTPVVNKVESVQAQVTTDENTGVSKETQKQSVKAEEIHADIYIEHPNFTSIQAFEQWLKTGSGHFDDQRNQLLANTLSTQSFTYQRTENDWAEYGDLEKLQYQDGDLEYWYVKDDQKKFSVHVRNDDNFVMYDLVKEQYEKGSERAHLVQDSNSHIDYYYRDRSSSALNEVCVFWKQFDRVHYATFNGYTEEEVEELIPLLKLEQVTVKLNNDHVTQ